MHVTDEIESQPDSWRRARALLPDVAGALPEPGERVAVIGCGTSWFMAEAFANLRAVLTANGMAVENIVKTTVFLTDRGLLPIFRSARSAVFGDHAPASTLLFVAGLADPRFVVEIEAEAVA